VREPGVLQHLAAVVQADVDKFVAVVHRGFALGYRRPFDRDRDKISAAGQQREAVTRRPVVVELIPVAAGPHQLLFPHV